MSSVLKLIIIIIQLLRLRKELLKPGSDVSFWELDPVKLSLDWSREDPSEGGRPVKAKSALRR